MVLHSRGCGRVARRRILSLEDLPVESLGGFPEGPFFVFPLGAPVGRKAPGTPFLFCCAGPPAGARFPGVPGGFSCSRSARSVSGFQRDFCYSTKTSGEQIFFSERAFDTVYDTVC